MLDSARDGLAPARSALQGRAGPVAFTVVHEAGTLACSGTLKRAFEGIGRCRFTSDPDFEAALGYAPKGQENVNFARSFWWSARVFGRTDERLVTARYYLSFGLKEGWRRALDNMKIALAFVRKGRMHIGLPHRIKRKSELKAILDKAAEIERRESGGR